MHGIQGNAFNNKRACGCELVQTFTFDGDCIIGWENPDWEKAWRISQWEKSKKEAEKLIPKYFSDDEAIAALDAMIRKAEQAEQMEKFINYFC